MLKRYSDHKKRQEEEQKMVEEDKVCRETFSIITVSTVICMKFVLIHILTCFLINIYLSS